MEIQDDRIGFLSPNERRQGCLGIANMQERARSHGWRFTVESSPGKGTCISVEGSKQ